MTPRMGLVVLRSAPDIVLVGPSCSVLGASTSRGPVKQIRLQGIASLVVVLESHQRWLALDESKLPDGGSRDPVRYRADEAIHCRSVFRHDDSPTIHRQD